MFFSKLRISFEKNVRSGRYMMEKEINKILESKRRFWYIFLSKTLEHSQTVVVLRFCECEELLYSVMDPSLDIGMSNELFRIRYLVNQYAVAGRLRVFGRL